MASKRKPVFSFVSDDEPEIVYCPYCEKVGVRSKLQERVYDDDKPLPYDADQWMQCYRCGKTIPIYDVKEELNYQPIVDIIESPFDSGTEILAVDKRTKKGKRKKKPNDDEDSDIQSEHGQVNILYDSSGQY